MSWDGIWLVKAIGGAIRQCWSPVRGRPQSWIRHALLFLQRTEGFKLNLAALLIGVVTRDPRCSP